MSAGNMGGRSLTEREMWEQGKVKLTDEELIKRGWKKDPNPPPEKPVLSSETSSQATQQDGVERILKEVLENNKSDSLLICGFLNDICVLLKDAKYLLGKISNK